MICAAVVRHMMLGTVACRGGGLLLVDGVSAGTGMYRDLQNQGANGKQKDADRKLAQSAASRPEDSSCPPAHAPPSFPAARRVSVMSRSCCAPPDAARQPR